MHVLTVVGARPQFVKAAVVSRVIRERSGVKETILHTGQHYDANMSDVFFSELDIPKPGIQLDVGSGSHGKQTGAMLAGIEDAILSEKPDVVLVYGDTNSTLAGALAAAKLHVPVAHVEAGLRSYNRRMPEEINRVTADVLSTVLFVPTGAAVENLAKEGLTAGVHRVGDVMYDASLFYAAKADTAKTLGAIGVEEGKFVLCTVHRAENTDDRARMSGILAGLGEIATHMPVLVPMHPRTTAILARESLTVPEGVRIIEPVPYLSMVALERSAACIVTDSGGVQKEAYFYGVPCVTMRDETEWVETVKAGWNRLVGADAAAIADGFRKAIGEKPSARPHLYGDGKSGEHIVQLLGEYHERNWEL